MFSLLQQGLSPRSDLRFKQRFVGRHILQLHYRKCKEGGATVLSAIDEFVLLAGDRNKKCRLPKRGVCRV